MQSHCTECGEPLEQDVKFCTSCGAPVLTTPPTVSPPASPQEVPPPAAPETPLPARAAPNFEPPAAIPNKPALVQPRPEKTPPSPPERSIPVLYIAAAIVGLVVIVGAIFVFGMPSEPDPVVGSWSYTQPPVSVWVTFSANGKGEIVIADARDGFYMDHNLTWEKTEPNEYKLYSEKYNFYYFNLNDAHTLLTPDVSSPDAVLTRTSGTKPSAPPRTGSGPRFTAGDVIASDPFEDYMFDVVLAYYPETDKYATDIIFFDDPGYHTPGGVNYTHRYSRSFIEQDNLKMDHINISSIRAT